METGVGEVTDSGLPENLVDFVICVRIIEYIFWPDCIRHYFTPKEIKEWASQIGPGQLYGVQYEKPEPKDSQTEERYRKVEENPIQGSIPYNWVFIGKIEKKFTPKTYISVIPTSRAKFQFPAQRYDRLKTIVRKIGLLLPQSVREIGRKILLRF